MCQNIQDAIGHERLENVDEDKNKSGGEGGGGAEGRGGGIQQSEKVQKKIRGVVGPRG